MEVAIVWVVALVCAAFVLSKAVNSGDKRVDPKDVLARRFAAGEIDEGEYLMRLSILNDANELTS